MIDILRASAGSGKTFNLAKTYIRILLTSEEDHPYRHILAVTFTNKATAEMKNRILKELSVLAREPRKSGYFKDFVPAVFPDAGTLQSKAGAVLTDILHDYGAFSISTIDKFFQQTLKAFSREIGQFSSYQIELDRNSLIHESVDRILDSLTESSSDLLDWLERSVMEQLEQGSKVNLESRLYEMAEKLSSEERKTISERLGLDETETFSKEKLRAVSKECNEAIEGFVNKVRDTAGRAVAAFDASGVSLSDTNRGFMTKLSSYAEVSNAASLFKPTEAFLRKAADPDQWFSKAKAKDCLAGLGRDAFAAVDAFCALWGTEYKVFNTAAILKAQTYGLGLAGELRREFDALLKEKNVLGIEDSNQILKDIIDGSDAPFVYEKLGVRFENFLLDEFQDTSDVQWQNFYPLLKESDDNGRENLIVGDVKQSIYRWRGSEWELLASKVAGQFEGASQNALVENWRSTRAVVEFNNSFFGYSAGMLDALTGIPGFHEISEIYRDVVQTPKTDDPQPGCVETTFCDRDSQLEEVEGSIRRAVAAGAGWGDIAILVRNNKEGGDIASYLISCGIPVLSDDSLDVKSSATVRRLVSLLSCVDNPDDRLNSFLASELDVTFPERYHSLVDLCEGLLRELRRHDEDCFNGEVLYIQSFMDTLLDWSSQNGNNLMLFLRYWAENCFRVSSPADADAVRVMTIHKSKGLEFPHVIFPFAEKVTLSGKSWHWCRPAADGTALAEAGKGIFPITMNKGVQDTLFEDDYRNEQRLQLVDSINTFYVALTRAGKSLHVISAMPAAKCLDACRSGAMYEFTDFSQLLFHFVKSEHFVSGAPYDFRAMRRDAPEEVNGLEASYPSVPVNPVTDVRDEKGDVIDVREQGRLKFSADSVDFFGEDGTVGAAASNRLNGIVLHGILSAVRVPGDLREAVDREVEDGQISPEEGELDFFLLRGRIESAKARGWFPEDAEFHNEDGIISPDGQIYRPDRVVVSDGHTYVIDYKFGTEEPRYSRQVARYVDLYRQMGYPDVSGYIWYVYDDKVTEVENTLL